MRLNRFALWARIASLATALALLGTSAVAAPTEFIPVGDPIEDELRLLDLATDSPGGARLRLPHLGTRPLQRFEVGVPGPATRLAGPRVIAVERIERALAIEGFWDDVPGATPRLVQWVSPDESRAELSAVALGEHQARSQGGNWRDHWRDGSGVHARAGLAADRWLLFSDVYVGSLARARAIGDPLVHDTDIALHSEETYAAWTPASGSWVAQFGRSRWHWGPGREASLLLSRSAPAMTGLAFRMRIAPLRADATILNATLSTSEHRQLAAHRLEWRPVPALRLGVAEAAVYRGDGWRPIYLLGLVPYSLAQRLEAEESLAPDTTGTGRNNLMVALDAAWRVADGTRVYGEWLIDDLHARTASVPNKWGMQLGLDGMGDLRGTRLSWNVEWTRLSRWVYTSFFGAQAAIRGEPLGSVLGPDSERLRAHLAWDPGTHWQVTLDATHSRKGENDLDEPFVPGTPPPDPGSFEGVASSMRELEGGLRWWPSRGVDVSAAAGWYRVDDADHVRGATREGATARVAFRVSR